ncbi:MAG TPA: DUF1194 domain-containing protein [Xanthobacteraceae bacterium]
MRETGTKRSSDASVWQSTAAQAFVGAVVAMVLTQQSSPAQAGMRTGAETVDTALVLAVDVSESINTERYALQMAGIGKTFEDPEIQQMILSGPNHSMFVALVEWSSKAFLSIPWTLITSPGEAEAFADKVQRAPRLDNQFTCLARALQVVRDKVLPFLPVAANRTIIDVSGDGRDNCNTSPPVEAVRDQLVADGVTINGLPILEGDEAATLEAWYAHHVIGGPAAFLVPALGFSDFERAMRKKFLVEVSSRFP